MPEPVVEIPNRPAFRSSEVCEIAQIPPYVLRSWEKEFPGLGVAPRPGAPRVYRRADVEQVLKIKHLLFNDGLTLAGARRKLEGEPKAEEEPLPEMPLEGEARAKVARIKQELRSLLDLLSTPGGEKKAEEAPAAPDPASPSAAAAGSHGFSTPASGVPRATADAPNVEEPPVIEEHPATWPPAAGAARRRSRVGGQPAAPGEPHEEELPLLEGVPEDAAAAKPARRPRRRPGPSPRDGQ